MNNDNSVSDFMGVFFWSVIAFLILYNLYALILYNLYSKNALKKIGVEVLYYLLFFLPVIILHLFVS